MIVFDLECLNGHTFEGWFDDRQDLDCQLADHQILCPVCETASVTPKLSPVAVRTSSSAASAPNPQRLQATEEAIAEFTEKVANFVEKNYEDVGPSFATEALKMHYGSIEYKNIRGTTTKEEEKVLEKEGVPVLKVPVPKTDTEDLN